MRLPHPCVLAALLAALAPVAGASTNVPPGPIINQHWTLAGSPYDVTGDVTVSVLTIDPGVQVVFQGNFLFDVLSSFNALGTEAQPILFTYQSQTNGWKGIRFQNNPPNSTLTWCRVEWSNDSGMKILHSRPVLQHCTFVNNTKSGTGGGLDATMNVGADLVLDHCTFARNQSTSHGGGLQAIMTSGTLRLLGCRIEDNAVNLLQSGGDYVGGGVRVTGSAVFDNTWVRRNTCYSIAGTFGTSTVRGGGIYSDTGSIALTNCIVRDNFIYGNTPVFGNSFAYGSGIHVETGPATLTNCILAYNTDSAVNRYGSGLNLSGGVNSLANCTIAYNAAGGLASGATATTLRNSIVFYNNANNTQISGTPTAEYCDIQGFPPYPGVGNINYDPVFCGNDLSITLGSSCIDAGDPGAAYNDVAFPPSLGTVVNDIGAHGGPLGGSWEYPGFLLELNDVDLLANEKVVFTSLGGFPSPAAIDAILVLTHSDGVPLFAPLVFGSYCEDGIWILSGTYPGGGGGHTFGFTVYGFTPDGSIGISNEAVVTLH